MTRLNTEKFYECEVKRLFKIGDLKERRWMTKAVAEALIDGDTEFRCKDCHGAVKLFNKNVVHGPSPHAEHKTKQDSEYCPSGMHFRLAKDGRSPSLSLKPVQ
jgi:hypothetical protein